MSPSTTATTTFNLSAAEFHLLPIFHNIAQRSPPRHRGHVCTGDCLVNRESFKNRDGHEWICREDSKNQDRCSAIILVPHLYFAEFDRLSHICRVEPLSKRGSEPIFTTVIARNGFNREAVFKGKGGVSFVCDLDVEDGMPLLVREAG